MIFDGPWRWSDDGCRLLDNTGRTVLHVLPSDGTEEELRAIEVVPEMAETCALFSELLIMLGKEAPEVLSRFKQM